MLEVIFFLHSNGIVHRCLVSSYFLVDDKYNLRLINYGFSAPIQGRDGAGLLMTMVGGYGSMAPEIWAGQAYEGEKVDLFALGVELFNFYRGTQPFLCAIPRDPHYRTIA
jgi:serine/threonine protein kinase